MSDITTLRASLRRELHDEDAANYRWSDDELDRHLGRAGRELSQVLPREQKTTLTTSAGSRDLSIAGLADIVEVFAVEYPAGLYPPSYVQWSVWQTTLTMLVDAAPASVQDVNVYWGSLHQLDGDASTVPAVAEDAVVMGAGAYAALEWASFATNRANIAGADAPRDYERWGRAQLALFRERLRAFGKAARVRTSQLYSPDQAAPSKATVRWEP